MKKAIFVLSAALLLVLSYATASYAQFNGLYDGSFPLCQDINGQHLNWNGNLPGGGPVCGTSTGASSPAIGSPNARTLSLATAYQATDTSKGALVYLSLNATPSLTLSGGSTNTAEIVIGPTSAVASGTGSSIGRFNNSLTGTLVVGVTINGAGVNTSTVAIPAGWYFAVRQTAGTVSIASAFDQSIG